MRFTYVMRSMVFVVLFVGHQAGAEVPAGAVWIDVRTTAEYAEDHLDQATLIPFDGIETGIAELQLGRDTPIYLYCGSGGRAEIAKQRLEGLGYTNVTNAGGLDEARELAGVTDT